MPIYWLLTINTFTGSRYWAIVDISWMFISTAAAQGGLSGSQYARQRFPDIADNRQIDAHILVDRRRVDVDVDLLGTGGKGIETAGDTIVEARPDCDHQVAVVHRHVRFVGAVH